MVFTNILRYCNIQRLETTEIFQRLERMLKEDKWYKVLLDYVEETSNLNRVYVVTGCGFLILVSLLYNFGIQLICDGVCFLYPGYKTIESLENFDVQQGKAWLTYWLVVSAFNFLDTFLFFLHWIPGYWIMKCFFYAWCFVPIQPNGSDIVYNFIIRPYFKQNQGTIDEAINSLKKTAQVVCFEPDLDAIRNHRT